MSARGENAENYADGRDEKQDFKRTKTLLVKQPVDDLPARIRRAITLALLAVDFHEGAGDNRLSSLAERLLDVSMRKPLVKTLILGLRALLIERVFFLFESQKKCRHDGRFA